MRFSERYGFKSVRDKLQLDSLSAELRNTLWSVLEVQVWRRAYRSPNDGWVHFDHMRNPELRELCGKLWFSYFKKPIDTLPDDWAPVLQMLRAYFFSCEWCEVYDFVEFVVKNFPFNDGGEKLIGGFNFVLEREKSGYRFVGTNITPITDETEIKEIHQALTGPMATVRAHLRRALELLSDREKPDYRNSIKESISAVESLVIAKLGEKGTLGKLTKKLEDEIKMHPALANSLGSLYGYTSDGDGIRHALMDLPKVTFEDAKFLLVVCSAFVNFVEHRM